MTRPTPVALQANKMTITQIKRHIDEFESAATTKEINPRKFYARGAYLSGLRDDIATRLQTGWAYFEKYPGMEATDAAELWFGLLEQYERACDALVRHADVAFREEAARYIFDGVKE